MFSPGLQLVYLVLVAAYLLVMALRHSRMRGRKWTVAVVLIWSAVFAALTAIAENQGWRLP